MTSPIDGLRRVVTGVGSHGKGVVLADGPVTWADHLPNGTIWAGVWRMPAGATAPLENSQDGFSVGFPDIPGGSQLTLVQLPPPDVGFSRMHRSDTIDYFVVLSGRIGVRLDGGEEFELAAGDVMVVGGNEHQYENRSEVPCRAVIVNIGLPSAIGAP